tara:strand:+ start:366 stop:992 length:627 start_codon:yes stop_codon:yes gene_type:complete
MFPFPKIDNNMILIISVFLIIYVLTLEKGPDPIKKLKKQVNDNILEPAKKLVENPYPSTEQNTVFFTQTCNGMNMPPGSKCNEEDFTQECPNMSELLAKQIKSQNANWKKSRDVGLPFPENDGPSSEVKYIGKQENDSWFDNTQYETIQKIVEDPSRQMKTTQGNVIPAGGDTRAWPELYQTDQQLAALILQSLPTQGNNVQTNQLSA